MDRNGIFGLLQNVTVREGYLRGKGALQRVNTGFVPDVLHFATRYILQRDGMKWGGIFPIVNH